MHTRYAVVLATDPSTLASQVEDLMKQGWEAQGGVSVAEIHDDDGAETQWAQAMVRRPGARADTAGEEPTGEGDMPRVAPTPASTAPPPGRQTGAAPMRGRRSTSLALVAAPAA